MLVKLIRVRLILLLTMAFMLSSLCASAETVPESSAMIDEPLYKPFIERYILDELKLLRQDQQFMRTEMVNKVAEARLEATDRAVRYTTDTVNNIFFIITGAASILVLLGWRSLREVRETVTSQVERQVSGMTKEYERRLDELETKLVIRSEQIISAQEKISETNQVHSLWMRAGLENSLHEQINIYDQILEVNPNDLEALTYKADSLLDLGEARWALSLSNQAIEHDKEYALAYWQRACAAVALGHLEPAVRDIEMAILKSPPLRDELAEEKAFKDLVGLPAFDQLIDSDGTAAI